jgi:type IX secretion system PorP/SprF family membrane protein
MKSKFKIYLSAVALFVCSSTAIAQQNVQFSQYVFNSLTVNPAYAGYKEDWYAHGIYRHQWGGFPGAPRTGGLSVDGLLNDRLDRVGVGAQLMFDKLGPQDMISAYGFYSYRIPLNEDGDKRLCLGLGAGVTQYSVDGSALQYVDNGDEALPVTKTSVRVPDARFGVYYFTPKFYLGASMMDLFSLYTDNTRYGWSGYNYRTIRKTQHLYVQAGWMADLSETLKLKPSLLVKEDFKGPTNVDLNLFLLIAEKLWVGGSYRTGVKLWDKPNLEKGLEQTDAASFMAEFYATPQIRIGYSYDMQVNKLAGYQDGSHEISIGYTFINKQRRQRITSPRYF